MKAKRIADPVHGTIELSPLEVDLIQTLTFQRLRGVKQLGLAHLVFPGADYSRFSHSIGAAHVTGRLVDALRTQEVPIDDHNRSIYQAAGLLHDLGHYPFSHAMERAVENTYKGQLTEPAEQPTVDAEDEPLSVPADHEGLGKMLITLSAGEVATVLEDHEIDPAKVAAVIGHDIDAPPYSNLVSSDLDADRIDYLLRTALHTGLPYGQVDLDYLLAMIRMDDHHNLCFDPRAMRTAEHLLLARYFDYQQVSYHKTIAGYECALEDVLLELMRTEVLNCSESALLDLAKTPSSWVEFDDAQVMGHIRNLARAGEGTIKYKATCLLERNGPKLAWSKEIIANHDEKRMRPFERLLRTSLTDIANRSGIPEDHFWVWSRSTKLTAMGSQIPASHLQQINDLDEAALGLLVRIGHAGESSQPLAECAGSLFNALAGQALSDLRLYFLPPDGQVVNREALARIVSSVVDG